MITQNSPDISFINNSDDAFKAAWRNDPASLKTLREESVKRYTQLGFPTVKDEEWKYTNLAPITQGRFEFSKQKADGLKLPANYSQKDEITIVFNNGILDEALSNFGQLPKGLNISTISSALKEGNEQLNTALKTFNPSEFNAVAALNNSLFSEGAFIRIDAKAEVTPVIHVIHITQSKIPIAYASRTIICLGQSAQANIVESHLSANDTDTYAVFPVTDIHLDKNATLHYCKAQRESLNAFHINNTRVLQEKDSNFDGYSILTGSKINRNNLDIILNGEGITSLLNGLYCINGAQLVDNHTCVDHRFPNCNSNQLYKGILNGSSHAVFNGKIFVKPIAQKTNSYQLNKNLLLGQDCRIDTKPQLEIFADDVKCTHGATIGQLDEDELFYLQTRCITRQDAKKMLAAGFMDELLNTIKSQPVQDKMHELVKPVIENL